MFGLNELLGGMLSQRPERIDDVLGKLKELIVSGWISVCENESV
jgi:hypothetical protein